ncbi:nuclear pore complex protein Nup155-like isoform X2 [Oncorhynchus masou masou]|uniref:nuclear pore complex protein Nup155-like isoform X2 n=1 Tax=Oncorhynchus masou masou TaxID=90313 RepID=UPI0031839EDE
MPSALGPCSPAAALAEALESSGRIIDRHLQEDRCFPDLSELLNVPCHNMPSLSGGSDMDYPLQEPGLLSLPNLPELSAVRRLPLPPELVEQFSHMQCNCMMGVFPEICRAWLTIDNDIMWNYEDGMSGGIQLLPDPLYSIPTDNTYHLAITSTDLGRIFLAGKDGCLYEVAYKAEAGWSSQRCRKINHSKSSLSFLVPSLLQFSFSEDGVLLMAASKTEDSDILWCINHDSFPFKKPLMEAQSLQESAMSTI